MALQKTLTVCPEMHELDACLIWINIIEYCPANSKNKPSLLSMGLAFVLVLRLRLGSALMFLLP